MPIPEAGRRLVPRQVMKENQTVSGWENVCCMNTQPVIALSAQFCGPCAW